MTRRTLLFLRHGKSDWDAEFSSDHERPLAPRGLRAARDVGKLLRRLALVPDVVISSTAVRARTTVEIAAEAGEWESEVRLSRRLYASSPHDVLEEIAREAESVETLLVAGHEPVWSSLVSQLIGGGAIRYPTAALACIQPYGRDWRGLGKSGGELLWLLPPRLLAKMDL